MTSPVPPAPLIATLQDLITWLKAQKVPHLIVGGVAASLLARPRLTRDVDVLIFLSEEKWTDLLKTAPLFGFIPRRADALAFARRSRVLLVRHEPTETDVDVILGSLPFEKDAIAGPRRVRLGKLTVPVPSPEDFIIMKAVGNRPRDLADIEAVLDTHPGLDFQKIRRVIRNFSQAVDMPGMLSDLETILAKKRQKKLKPTSRGK